MIRPIESTGRYRFHYHVFAHTITERLGANQVRKRKVYRIRLIQKASIIILKKYL